MQATETVRPPLPDTPVEEESAKPSPPVPPGPPSEFCPGCPVPHRFLELAPDGGPLYTHDVTASGDLFCHRCSVSRPCLATVVKGRAGHRLKGPEGLGEPPVRHREWTIR
jgi:TPP-dependent indolepyruvate ferredoxin oxidoreductase alpha subunit